VLDFIAIDLQVSTRYICKSHFLAHGV